MFQKLVRFADDRNINSWAVRLRKRRFVFFKTLIHSLPRPIRILDIGGTPVFWERMGIREGAGIEIWLLNLERFPLVPPHYHSVVGDAKDLRQFQDREFDVVFSNSVIEHLPDFKDQHRMAEEMRRVGEMYYLQTPNRYFPIETHFLFPFFQFLPLRCRVWLISHFNIGWYKKRSTEEAIKAVHSIRLLTEKELRALFPKGTVHKERFLGIIKSLIIYGGWGVEERISGDQYTGG